MFEADGTYYMHNDAAGPIGWLTALATSKDLIHWQKKGPVLELGKAGENDSASASYGTSFYDGRAWHMFYLGTPHTSPAPDLVPAFPYLTMKARSTSPAGPWVKQRKVIPFQARHLILGHGQPPSIRENAGLPCLRSYNRPFSWVRRRELVGSGPQLVILAALSLSF